MASFDFLRPKWRRSNPVSRRDGVRELRDEAILVDLAENDPDRSVRMSAVMRLNMIRPRWQHSQADKRKEAIEELDDEATLEQLAKTDVDQSVREAALHRLDEVRSKRQTLNNSQSVDRATLTNAQTVMANDGVAKETRTGGQPPVGLPPEIEAFLRTAGKSSFFWATANVGIALAAGAELQREPLLLLLVLALYLESVALRAFRGRRMLIVDGVLVGCLGIYNLDLAQGSFSGYFYGMLLGYAVLQLMYSLYCFYLGLNRPQTRQDSQGSEPGGETASTGAVGHARQRVETPQLAPAVQKFMLLPLGDQSNCPNCGSSSVGPHTREYMKSLNEDRRRRGKRNDTTHYQMGLSIPDLFALRVVKCSECGHVWRRHGHDWRALCSCVVLCLGIFFLICAASGVEEWTSQMWIMMFVGVPVCFGALASFGIVLARICCPENELPHTCAHCESTDLTEGSFRENVGWSCRNRDNDVNLGFGANWLQRLASVVLDLIKCRACGKMWRPEGQNRVLILTGLWFGLSMAILGYYVHAEYVNSSSVANIGGLACMLWGVYVGVRVVLAHLARVK